MKATREIAGHELTLTVGRRYRAGRPIARSRDDKEFVVSIEDLDMGGIAATLPPLSYDDANAFLAAFNDGPTSFAGRVWRDR